MVRSQVVRHTHTHEALSHIKSLIPLLWAEELFRQKKSCFQAPQNLKNLGQMESLVDSPVTGDMIFSRFLNQLEVPKKRPLTVAHYTL